MQCQLIAPKPLKFSFVMKTSLLRTSYIVDNSNSQFKEICQYQFLFFSESKKKRSS